MARRITITIYEEIEAKLRDLQAKKIKESNRNVSFSQIINQILANGLNNNNFD